MRLIYICDICQKYIGEINIDVWDESMLGFDVLSNQEKGELLHFDWGKEVGTVKAICDSCWHLSGGVGEEFRGEERLH